MGSFGLSGGISLQCFERDGVISMFRNGVSKLMVVFRNGWWCFDGVFGFLEPCLVVLRSGWEFRNGDLLLRNVVLVLVLRCFETILDFEWCCF